MRERAGRWRLVGLLAIVAGAVLLRVGWKGWDVRRDRIAIAEIEQEIKNGRHATATRRLHELLARKPGSDAALYLLGTCELARGRPQPAAEAWARVAPDSPFAASALLGRMKIETERGRFSETEQIIRDARDDPRVEASSVLILLEPLYRYQGRLAESLHLIERRWDALDRAGEGATEQAINLVRSHIEHQQNPMSPDAIRSILDQAASLAPDDDRVWLGKANLAIRSGSFDEAKRWLDACLQRRPEDIPVWRARLDWAVRTNHVAAASEALKHLPVAESPPAEAPRLAAWLAAQARGSWCRTAGPRTPHRGRSRRPCRSRPARRPGDPGRPTVPRRRSANSEGRDRATRGALPETLSAQSTSARLRGDGAPGRTARPGFPGQGQPDRGHRHASGP